MKKEGFNLGDRVVLPAYGIGIISAVSTQAVANNSYSYYQVEFPNGTSKAYVPMQAPESVGMRPALTNTEIPEIMNRLQNGQYPLPRQWAARHRKVTDILAAGNPFEIASLASELRRWNIEKGLPDLDRQAYRKALKVLAQEIGEISDKNAQQARDFINNEWESTDLVAQAAG